jgi:hypothetical protein
MPVLPANAISSNATATPPSLMSWPALMTRCRSSPCVALNAAASVPASTSGESSPIWGMIKENAISKQCRQHGAVLPDVLTYTSRA